MSFIFKSNPVGAAEGSTMNFSDCSQFAATHIKLCTIDELKKELERREKELLTKEEICKRYILSEEFSDLQRKFNQVNFLTKDNETYTIKYEMVLNYFKVKQETFTNIVQRMESILKPHNHHVSL